MKILLAGIIGTGSISNTHVEGIRSTGNEIVFCLNKNIKGAESFSTKHNIPYFYDDFQQAIQSHKIDIVHVCTPPTSHYFYGKLALENNINVIMEKPMCLKIDEARELYNLSREKGLIFAVNFNIRYYDQILKMREIVSDTDFDEPILIRAHYLQQFHCLPTMFSWRYDENLGGKMRAVTEIGSHIIDLIRFVLGIEITEISANFGNFNNTRYIEDNIMTRNYSEKSKEIKVNSEDTCFINFRLENGAMGNIFLSEISHGHTNEIELEVTSRECSVLWNSNRGNILISGNRDSGVRVLENPFGVGFKGTFSRFITSVYESMDNNVEGTFANVYDGLMNSIICEKIYESNEKNGKWIRIGG